MELHNTGTFQIVKLNDEESIDVEFRTEELRIKQGKGQVLVFLASATKIQELRNAMRFGSPKNPIGIAALESLAVLEKIRKP